MKPMLAAACTDLNAVKYPVLISPKFDGIRAIILNGVVLSRSFKPIPNQWVQDLFGRAEYNGFDGELIVGPPTAKDVFNRTSSAVMSRAGAPDVRFWVFDNILDTPDKPFATRLAGVQKRLNTLDLLGNGNARMQAVNHQQITNASEAEQQEIWLLKDGFEGMMIRSFHGPYKYGRSTGKEGYLLKVKQFEDGEAEVLRINRLMHNENAIETNELGEKERSTKKGGKVESELMGSIVVSDLKTGVVFEIGTGFTPKQRAWWWKNAINLLNETPVVKYKFQVVGVKDKPRFPVFIGFRDRRDL